MRIDTMTLRLTNISAATSPNDLRKLLVKYGGALSLRVHWEKSGETSAIFVVREEDGEDALQFLNGRTWRGLRVRVEKLDSDSFWDGDADDDDADGN
jgi:hypothetical protein